MSNKRDFFVWAVAAACAVLAVLPFKAAHGQEVDINQQICRGNLQFLGAALGLYLQENGGRLPARMSQLYAAGYVLDPGVFVCPGAGKQTPREGQIDELTDFEMVAALPQERPARLVWQKTAVEGAPRLAFYSDGSIQPWEADADSPSGTETRASNAGERALTETSLSDGAENARPVPEVEPNNSRDDASLAEVGKALEATLGVRGDTDWYRVDVDHQGALGVKVDTVPEGLEMQFRVYDAKGNAIARPEVSVGKAGGYSWVLAHGPGMEVVGVADLPAPGTYYVEVKEGRNRRSAEPYGLALSFTPSADTGEMNNGLETATPIQIGARIAANMLPRGDSDWYSVSVDHQGALGVKVDEAPEDLEMRFRVYDAKGNAIARPEVSAGKAGGYNWVVAHGPGTEVAGVADLPAPGTYYVEVKEGGNRRSAEPYGLALNFTPSADTGETNNGLETATPIQIGERIAANMLPRGDSDWYWLAVGHPGALGVKMDKVPEGLEMQFRVYDAKGNAITRPEVSAGKAGGYHWVVAQGPGTEVAGVADLPARGTYYVEVEERHGARSEKPYELALSFVTAADDGEPDGNRALASLIETQKSVTATIMPRGDIDWYRFRADAEGVLSVQIDESPENLKIAFRVHDSNTYITPEVSRGKAGGYGWVVAQKKGDSSAATIELPSAGTYYLEMKAWDRNVRSPEAYSFKTAFSSVR